MAEETLLAKIGMDISALKAASVEAADEFKKLGGHVADHVGGMRKVSGAVVAALGIDMKDIAENLARFVTGMTKENEEAFKRAGQLSDQATDLAIKNMRSRLIEEQRYQLAIQERDKLQSKLDGASAKSGKDMEEIAKTRLELEQKISEITAYETKTAEASARAQAENVKQRADLNMEQERAALKNMDIYDRHKKLSKEVADTERLISGLKADGLDTTGLENQLRTKQKLLAETTGEVEKDRMDAQREWLDEEDQARADEEAANRKFNQDVLDQLAAEKQITEERKKQADELERQARTFDGMKIGVSGSDYGGYVQGATTAALMGEVARLTTALHQVGQSGRDISAVGINENYGDWATASMISGNLTTAQKELALRNAVATDIGTFGEEHARGQYGDAVVNRAMQDVAKQNSANLNSISRNLGALTQLFTNARAA